MDSSSVFAGTILADREFVEIPDPRSGEVVVACACTPSEMLDVWSCARDALQVTGRWPVVFANWDSGAVDESLIDPFPDFDGSDDLVGFAGRLASEPLASAEAVATTRWSVAAHRPFGPVDGTHLEWFEPDESIGLALVLLPTPNCWEVPLYLEFFGCESSERVALLARTMHAWHERYGAEIVAHFGTMMEFGVASPPMTKDEAVAVGAEQSAIAPSTLDLAGVSEVQHARTLIGRDTWFLHERP
jgi:hypothetical protein